MQVLFENAKAETIFWKEIADKCKDIEVYREIKDAFIPPKLMEFVCSGGRNKPVMSQELKIGSRIYEYKSGKGAKQIELGHVEASVFGPILVWNSGDKIYGSTVLSDSAKDGDCELIFDNGSYKPVGQYMNLTDASRNSMGVLFVIDHQAKTGKLGETVIGDEIWTVNVKTRQLEKKLAEYVSHDGAQGWARVINDQGWLYFEANFRKYVRRGLSSEERQALGHGPDFQVWDSLQKSVTHNGSTYTAYLQNDGTYAFEVNDEVYKYHPMINTSRRFGKWIHRSEVRMLFKYDPDGRLRITEVVNDAPQEGNRIFEYEEATNSIKQFIFKYDDQGVLQKMLLIPSEENTEYKSGYIYIKMDAEGREYRVFVSDDTTKDYESLDVWLEYMGKSAGAEAVEDKKRQITYCEYEVSKLDGSRSFIRIAQDKSYSDKAIKLHDITQGAVRLAKNVQDGKTFYGVEEDFVDGMKKRIIYNPSDDSLGAYVQKNSWRLSNQGNYENVSGEDLWVPLNGGVGAIYDRMVQLKQLSDDCILQQIGYFTTDSD